MRRIAKPRAGVRHRQSGFSLVELMVSLMVGLMVVGALMATYYSMSVSGRQGQAMSQITEDASLALNMLRGQVAQAAYSRPIAAPAGTAFTRAYTGAAIAVCDGDFTDPSVAIGTLTCVSNTGVDTLTDSLAVAYEADTSNSVASGGVPLDCLGNALAYTGVAPTGYYLNYSRFYLATSKVSTRKALYCRGPGSASGQALVENVEDMQVLYGVTNTLAPLVPPAQVDAYVKASAFPYVNPLAAGQMVTMANVISVRLCITVASTDEVLDEPTAYRNCQNTSVTPTDRRIYRTFRSTVLLPNRLGPV